MTPIEPDTERDYLAALRLGSYKRDASWAVGRYRIARLRRFDSTPAKAGSTLNQ